MKAATTLLAALLGVTASQAQIEYHTLATTDVVFTRFDENTLAWTSSVPPGAYRLRVQRDPSSAWRDLAVRSQVALSSALTNPVPRPDFAPADSFAIVPAGPFTQGDTLEAGGALEQPAHTVDVSQCFLALREVSNEELRAALQWAHDHGQILVTTNGAYNTEGQTQLLVKLGHPACGLDFTNGAFAVKAGRGAYPAVAVSWYGALAYGNYRSDAEGMERAVSFADWSVDRTRSGYRLPSESEWERGARGGLEQTHFAWGGVSSNVTEDITGGDANYSESGDTNESVAAGFLTAVGSYNGGQTPGGPDRANGYGLYDTAGNVYEWCLDVYDYGWYTNAAASDATVLGPTTGLWRGVRGGSWADTPDLVRCAARAGALPRACSDQIGFRTARSF